MSLSHLQNIELVVFDFDGTIADTSEGILDSHKVALKSLGIEIPPNSVLKSFIGRNLLKVYTDVFNIDKHKAMNAVTVYRKRYADYGINKAILYSGFSDTLRALKAKCFSIGLATLKLEKFAVHMLQMLKIYEYFDVVCGMNTGDQLSKAELILRCVKYCGCSPKKTVMIGDSENDLDGAKEAGVNFIGVTYGFGFKSNTEYKFMTANNTKEILSILEG